jgi:aryl-alcohol dehydrogenase-like predicted oxidoreductase
MTTVNEKQPVDDRPPRLSRLALGCYPLGGGYGTVSIDDARSTVDAALDVGWSFLDTAEAYLDSESRLGEILQGRRERVFLATKVFPCEAYRYDNLRTALSNSLRRLRTDRIDLLHLHRIDPDYPLAEQIGALKQLQDEGKVRHLGLSEVTVEQVEEAAAVAPIASVQNLYNLAARDHDSVLDHATARGIAFLPFFPIAMGEHAGPGSPVAEVARELDASPAQTALAWLLHRAPNVIPIPGTSSLVHLEENLCAHQVTLSESQLARLSQNVPALGATA